ncbi:MAG TPA: PQQ-dependent sugar dehydrogenase [Burkholderiaceae bacterium]|nr:PQQ-dependent sugar dehydrogenase [Burkholderiaceae bacterium]
MAWYSLMRRHALALVVGTLLAACGGDEGPKAPPLPVGPVPPGGSGLPVRAVTFATGLVNPWGLAFLPDGRLLVTERPGRMRIVSADGTTLSAPLAGVPAVHAQGQGGLLDVAIDPDFAINQLVYWSYAEDGATGLSGTAVARGRLNGTTLDNVQVIFQQVPKVLASDVNYGARLVFANDKTLFVTLGERGTDNPTAPSNDGAQSLANHLGKVVRINPDGSVPASNPYVGVTGVVPELWSLGHRNPQGAALNPVSGELWLDEHGPLGGDEVNRIQAQHNYGWPVRSYGCPDGSPAGVGCAIGGGTHFPNFDEPLYKWTPTSTAPSGMLFYTGDAFPEWKGSLFVGALAGMSLWRFPLVGNSVGAPEQLFSALGERIRDVRQGPDGLIYLLTDNASGRIVRLQR